MEVSSNQVKRFMNLESTEMKMQVYTFMREMLFIRNSSLFLRICRKIDRAVSTIFGRSVVSFYSW